MRLARRYGEIADTVRRHTKNYAEIFRQDAHEPSVDPIEVDSELDPAAQTGPIAELLT